LLIELQKQQKIGRDKTSVFPKKLGNLKIEFVRNEDKIGMLKRKK
jgi:hypothetical protein